MVTDGTPAFRLAFVLPVDPIFTGALTRTDCAGVSARADKRHCSGHFSNPRNGANGNFAAALRWNSRHRFA